MSKHDFKDQELDLKMRIKFLEKKLREPDHDFEKYEEWQSNLEIVTDELTKLQVKKFKYFLGKWVHNFKESNQLINVVDCMFASLEEEDQKDVASKWYHRVIKEKDIKHYQLLASYTKEENETLKKRQVALKKKNSINFLIMNTTKRILIGGVVLLKIALANGRCKLYLTKNTLSFRRVQNYE